MKTKLKPVLPRRKIQAVCDALARADAALGEGPHTGATLRLRKRLLTLHLGALRIRKKLFPMPSTAQIVARAWRDAWGARRPTDGAKWRELTLRKV